MTDPDPTPGSCWLVVFDVPEKAAARFMAALEPFCVSVAAVRTGKPGLTRIEGIAIEPPPAGLLAAALALAAASAGIPEPSPETRPLAPRDWLEESRRAWPPIRAGRFFLKGSHYRGAVPPGSVPLTIDAGTAFGTGRHESTLGCLLALDQYLQSRSEEDRAALRAAYEAIPWHLRRYALGDMDSKDWPLRVLAVGKGGRLDYPGGNAVTVTDQMHQQALDYFADRQQEREKWARPTYPDGPEGADSPTVHLNQVFYPKGWPQEPGVLALRNEYPAAIVVDSVSYPTVVHAYWALAAADPATAEQIRAADRPYDAGKLAEQAAIRADWPVIRTGVMARLLRAKFAQRPQLAEILLTTGDGRIEYASVGSGYWNTGRGQGRNWMGRLLELIRSETAAQASSPAQPAP